MSKYNHYTNYSKFNAADTEPAVREAVGVSEDVEETEEVVDTIAVEAAQLAVDAEEKEEVAPPAEPETGVVTANKLNIRKLPSPGAEVVTVAEKNTKLMIDPTYSTVEWLHVYTEAGIEGYCMRKFVEVK